MTSTHPVATCCLRLESILLTRSKDIGEKWNMREGILNLPYFADSLGIGNAGVRPIRFDSLMVWGFKGLSRLFPFSPLPNRLSH